MPFLGMPTSSESVNKTVDYLAQRYARGDRKAILESRDFINKQPEGERKNLKKRFMDKKKLYQTEDWKWWKELQDISPERRANVFYDEYEDATPKKRREMLNTAKHLGGIRTDRFNKELKNLRLREAHQNLQ